MTGEESHWAFVGDSRIRQVYFEVLKLLDPDEVLKLLDPDSRFQIWKSARLITDSMDTLDDGLHLTAFTLKHHVQVKKICSSSNCNLLYSN